MLSITIVCNARTFNFATFAAIMETGVTIERAINSTATIFAKGDMKAMAALKGIGGTVSVTHDQERVGA